MRSRFPITAAGAAALLWLTLAIQADDRSNSPSPAPLSPPSDSIQIDNEHVRVFTVELKPGQKIPMHSHPGYVIYSLDSGQVRLTSPDGKVMEVQMKPGQAMWHDAESHAVENIGDTPFRVLHVELKGLPKTEAELAGYRQAGAQAKPTEQAGHREHAEHAEHRMIAASEIKWQAAPPGLPAGAEAAVLDGDPAKPGPFTLRAKFPAGYKIPAHHHPSDEHVTVISGGLYMGLGDKLDQSKGKEIAPGGFAVMPVGTRHFAWTTEETVIQLHGNGPWDIIYVNPADDPRHSDGTDHSNRSVPSADRP